MVLSFFVLLSGMVTQEFYTQVSAKRLVEKIYLKEQCYKQGELALWSFLRYFKQHGRDYEKKLSFWEQNFVFPLPHGTVTIKIVDEERFLNLNLVKYQEKGEEILERLFKELEVRSLTPEVVKTWITGEGYWDKPFPPKKAPFQSKEELLLLGMSKEDFYGKIKGVKLVPGIKNLTTVWGNGKININTSPLEVLKALLPPEEDWLAEKILDYRKEHLFNKVEDLLMVDGMTFELLHYLRPLVKTRSSFFRIEVEVVTGDVAGTIEAVVKKEGDSFKVVSWK